MNNCFTNQFQIKIFCILQELFGTYDYKKENYLQGCHINNGQSGGGWGFFLAVMCLRPSDGRNKTFLTPQGNLPGYFFISPPI